MLIVLAAPRPATAALAHTRKPSLNSIDLHQPPQLRSTAPIASPTATTPISALDPLATTPTPSRPRSNPHSARRTVPLPTARFPPLEVFRRRPLESVASFASGRHPKTFTQPDSCTTKCDGLLDHFVGAQDELRGYFVADRLSDLQIDHQLKSCRLLDGKLARVGAAQDLREQPCQLTKPLRNTWPVSREAAFLGHFRPLVHRRQAQCRSAPHHSLAVEEEQRRCKYVDSLSPPNARLVHGRYDCFRRARRKNRKLQTMRVCRILQHLQVL